MLTGDKLWAGLDGLGCERPNRPMCGRFTQHYSWRELHDALDVVGTPPNLRARYNIAPTTTIEVVRDGEEGRALARMRWGLIPRWWSTTAKDVPATFNARAETVASKPMFRHAFKKRRCIVPASGFYEWTGEKGDKVPHYFTAGDGAPVLAIAGLWETWHDKAADEEVLSATMVVGGANKWMGEYHDRMPILLAPGEIAAWLDGSMGGDDIKERTAPLDALREWVVSPRVNRTGVGDDDPSMTEAA